jgi:ATP-dependent DNA helicase RecQ
LFPHASKRHSDPQDGAIIIYTSTRRDAEEATEFVREVIRLQAEFYHAGMTHEERTRIQNEFIAGKLNVICATNAFGMGIDRADVRQVIHYSLPGSLEAYYQEAGRAGRDGLPAHATLIYDPADRATQEFFIDTSRLEENDLHAIYNALNNGEQFWVTIDELSRLTGLHPVQINVGLASLERGNALDRLGDEGFSMLLRKGVWNQPIIEEAILHSKEYARHRETQLAGIVDYAESNLCRRKIILDYFGDAGGAEAKDCCDNCRSARVNTSSGKAVDEMTHGERAALVILDCIRRAKIKIGREKLAQILHGSKAQGILRFQHNKNVYYGKLAALKQDDIENLVDQLVDTGYIKTISSKYPILNLTALGENAIQLKLTITLKLPRSLEVESLRRTKAKLEAGGTVEYTAKLFSDGFTPEQIAHERGLSPSTIYGHLAQLIEHGTIQVAEVIPAELRERIDKAIQKVGSDQSLAPIKAILPEEISHGHIRCVVAGLKRSKSSYQQDPEIVSFLTKSHPRHLIGSWKTGWALDFHSRFTGKDWFRSSVGDFTYRLKYEADTTVLPMLILQTLDLLRVHPEIIQTDVIVPVPSSTKRKIDPVQAFCTALASEIKMPMQLIVIKTRQNQPQKELKTLAQKRANVADAFSHQGEIKGKRILVVDDLYDSGATLEEITCLLLKGGASCVNVLTLTRTIHSDA